MDKVMEEYRDIFTSLLLGQALHWSNPKNIATQWPDLSMLFYVEWWNQEED